MRYNFDKSYQLNEYELEEFRWMYSSNSIYKDIPNLMKENPEWLFYKFHGYDCTCECFYLEDGELNTFFTTDIIIKLLTDSKARKNFMELHQKNDEQLNNIIQGSISGNRNVHGSEIYKYAQYNTVTTINFGI
jgi:hypothetical protein